MGKKPESFFDVGNDYIRKTKLEIQEMQKRIDEKKEKVENLEKAIVILNEDS